MVPLFKPLPDRSQLSTDRGSWALQGEELFLPSPDSLSLSRPHSGPLHPRGSPWELSTHMSLSPWLCHWPLEQNSILYLGSSDFIWFRFK